MQQRVQTDTNYNIQQCLQGALKNCRVYERVLPAKCQVRIRIECRGFAAKGANSCLSVFFKSLESFQYKKFSMVYALIDHRSGAKMLKIQGKRLQSLTIFDVIYLAVFSVFDIHFR